MDVDNYWIDELRKLKSAFYDHYEARTSDSEAALNGVLVEFQRYVKVNQGILRRTKENHALITRWNAFVKAVGQPSDQTLAQKQLLDAIDDALGAIYSKAQAAPSITTYNVGSIAGVFSTGPGAHVHDVPVTQDHSSHTTHINLPQLADELARLRDTMRATAKTLEDDAAVGAVAEAEKAARDGDRPRALERLKAAGKWALDVGTKIGVEIATSVLKEQLGIPK
jgi:hypothetical protein